ncbi:MAG: tetratricopeptide repeat protein [Candidatus Omnitrophota bacterium]
MGIKKIIILVLVSGFWLLQPAVSCAADKQEEDFFVAQKAFSDGFYELALESIGNFLKSYPNSPKIFEAYFLRGKCLLYQEKYSEAFLEFERLKDLPGSQNFKDAIGYWSAETYFKSGNLKEAKKLYEGLIKNFPQSSYVPFVYYSLGWSFFQEDNFPEALKYLKKIREQFPNHDLAEDAEIKICESFYNLKDYTNLRNTLTRFLKEYPRSLKKSQALFYLAESEYYLGDYSNAINDYLRTIEASKGSSRKYLTDLAKLGIGWCYIKLNNLTKAQNYLNQLSSDLAFLAKATLFTNQKEYEKALGLYEELIKEFPNSSCIIEALLGKADCLYELNKSQESISVYQEVLERIQKLPSEARDLLDKVHNGLAAVYLKLGRYKEAVLELEDLAQNSQDKIVRLSAMCRIADTLRHNSQFQEAVKTYNQILKDFPNNSYSDYLQYHLGLTLIELGQYDEALNAFGSLIANFPNSGLFEEAHFQLGMVYFKKGDFLEAKDLFHDFSIKFNNSPLKNEALYLVGESFYNLGDYKEAINIFQTILNESPEDLKLAETVEFEIANILNQIGESKEAIKRLNNFVNNHPDSELRPQVLLWLGRYYTENGVFDMARRNLWKLIREHPASQFIDDAFYYIGEIYLSENKFDLALRQFQRVLEFADTNLAKDAYMGIIDIYKAKDNIDGAISTCNELIAKFPDSKPVAFEKKADVYKAFDRYQEAIINYLKAINISSSSQLYFKLADSYEEKGDLEEAIKSYLEIGELYPKDTHWVVKAYLRSARIFENKRQYSEAENIYEKLAAMDVEEAKFAKEKLLSLKQEMIKGGQ